jgi:MFS transporter, DHA1 family, multidrug resistance protein
VAGLPEAAAGNPAAGKTPVAAPGYLAALLAGLSSPRFLLACAALALNFAGFFIYVLSAPVFLMQHLGLPETAFLWLFGPAMLGLMCGSWLSGRLAGKRTRQAGPSPSAMRHGQRSAHQSAHSTYTLPAGLPWSVAAAVHLHRRHVAGHAQPDAVRA